MSARSFALESGRKFYSTGKPCKTATRNGGRDGVKLPDLTKPQWDAALEAARQLMNGHPDNATDRAAFRNAKARLADLLPADVEPSDIIKAAVRWDMLNNLAASVAMERVL